MGNDSRRFFEFDNFLLDSQQRLLFRDGQPLDLTPKGFDILLELVQSGGRVVEKKELMDRIWSESFVEESNLTQQVSIIRKKLGPESDRQRYIVTVPGRGYRFAMSVKSWDSDDPITVIERVQSRLVVTDSSEKTTHSPSRLLTGRHPGVLRKHQGVLITLGLMLVAGIAIALLVKLSRRPALARFTQTKLVRFTTDGKVVCAAISPDGKHVAYALTDNGQQSLWIRQVATSNTGVQIIAPLNWSYIGLTFSPDNDYIYFTAQEINSPSPLYRVPALGGKPIRLIDDVDTPPTFSPDGKRIAYERGYPDVDETSLMIANADGSGETKLVSLKGPRTQLRLGAGPSWSPDGETIVCSVSVADDSGTHQELYQVAVRGGDVRALTNGKWLLVARVAWVGDGQGLMMTAADADTGISQVWYVSFPSGTPRRITNDLSEYRGLTLTADARLLAVVQSDQQSNVWVSPNLNGAGASPITSTNYDGFDGLSWTADGRLLYSAARNGFQDIWLTDSQGRHKTQLTENAGQNTAPVMSPDGHTIVFVSTRDGEQRLWRMDPDGSHPQRLTDGLKDMRPVFSADGQWVIYFSQSEQNILKISINGGVAASFLSEALPGSAAISPDGKMIALDYRKPALGKVKLAVAPLDNSGPVKLIDSHDVPHRSLLQWTSDGQAIAYIKTGGSASNVWLQPLAGGPSRQLTFFDSELIFNFAIARDGRLALTRGHEVNDLVLISSSD